MVVSVTGYAPKSIVIGYVFDLNKIEGMLNAVYEENSTRFMSKPQNLKDYSDLIEVVCYETGTRNQIVNFYMDEFLALAIDRAPKNS